MKKPLVLLILIISCFFLQAQENEVAATIRILEKMERLAVLENDTATLRKIWADDFTVNNPYNRVVQPGKTTPGKREIMVFRYSSFERDIENLMVKDDVVISMGNEVVVQQGENGAPDRTIKRRYTNIWMKENNEWKLTARHANEICSTK